MLIPLRLNSLTKNIGISVKATPFLLVSLIAVWAPFSLNAQVNQSNSQQNGDPRSSVLSVATAFRVSTPPTVDGFLDDAVWWQATPMSDFIQREPQDGESATESTEVRVIFDDEALYIGVWALDSNPAGIIVGEQIRDYDVAESDNVILIFDTYNDEQNGFVFGTTPSGIEYDGQVANEGQGAGRFFGGGFNPRRRFQSGSGAGFNKNWDGSWMVATSEDQLGWYAEFRIPFSTLRYGSENTSWGFNVARRVRRLNEESFWSPVPREFNLYRLNYAGDLEGLTPPFRRLGTVTPYVSTSTRRNYELGDAAFDRDIEFGGEAKVQITQGLTLDVTGNTDFAQVEVDDQQVNLTRFSLLFPEKRPFFLENSGFFTVGGGGADLFFSRKIGISGGGQVPIKGGGRLSGKVGGLNVGLLHIRTEGLESVAPENAYSVARIARELPNRSRVGALFVERNSNVSGDYNRTYAIDGRLGIGEAITLTSFVGRTETPGFVGDDHIVDATAGWSSRNWTSTLQAREIGEAFNPEVGFLPRNGHRYYQAYLQRFIRPSRVFREVRPHVSYFTFQSQRIGIESGFTESSRLHVDSHWEWPSGTTIHTGANFVREGLTDPFAITGSNVVVAPGSYDGWEAAFVLMSDRSAPLAVDTRLNMGSFLSGDRRAVTTTVTLRRGAEFSTSLRLEYNDVDLVGGRFDTRLIGVNVGYFFTPQIYLQSLVQYSDQIDRLSANIRFGWLNTAGTGLFIVYNDIQGIDQLDGPLGRSLILKFSRQLNMLGG